MALPATPLMVAPAGLTRDPFGNAMSHSDMIIGLRQINPRITERTAEAKVWYPGQDFMSCLWLGDPGGESTKISAFHYGPIPEFSQMNPDGSLMIKGWRQIFKKVIAAKAATKQQLEQKFHVSLETELGSGESCRECLKRGRPRRHDGGSLKLCKAHTSVVQAARGLLAKTRGM